jgi:chromosome segregation ATPase
MKLNEALGELKRLDGELNKLYDKRAKIVASKPTLYVDKMTLDEIKKVEDSFEFERKGKFEEIQEKLGELTARLRYLKTKIMDVNSTYQLNDKIIRLKQIRIELSKLMEMAKGDRFYGLSNQDTVIEGLEIYKEIERLENDKRKIDAELQYANWQLDVA